MNFNIRKALSTDIPFLTESVVEAEHAGTEIISYCTLFNIDKQKLVELISGAFSNQVGVQVWDINSWWVVEDHSGIPRAALASWIETGNTSTEMQKFQYLCYMLRADFTNPELKAKIQLLQKVAIPRKVGATQIDFVFTDKKYRGLGLMNMLLKHCILDNAHGYIQLQVLSKNFAAIKLYEKMGFKEESRLTCEGIEAHKLLADDTKLCMTYYE